MAKIIRFDYLGGILYRIEGLDKELEAGYKKNCPLKNTLDNNKESEQPLALNQNRDII